MLLISSKNIKSTLLNTKSVIYFCKLIFKTVYRDTGKIVDYTNYIYLCYTTVLRGMLLQPKTVFFMDKTRRKNMSDKTLIMDEGTIKRTITRLAHDILEKNNGTDNLCIVGIRTRGVYIADRIADYIDKTENSIVPRGVIDITFHRDDLGINNSLPEIKHSDIPFDVNGKNILIVDDVLYTGRTIRAAIETLMDYGRPKKIQLAVLIDRGHRELPICANYTGKYIPTSHDEAVSVLLFEHDGIDKVELFKKG